MNGSGIIIRNMSQIDSKDETAIFSRSTRYKRTSIGGLQEDTFLLFHMKHAKEVDPARGSPNLMIASLVDAASQPARATPFGRVHLDEEVAELLIGA